jgi:hypothetical protein
VQRSQALAARSLSESAREEALASAVVPRSTTHVRAGVVTGDAAEEESGFRLRTASALFEGTTNEPPPKLQSYKWSAFTSANRASVSTFALTSAVWSSARKKLSPARVISSWLGSLGAVEKASAHIRDEWLAARVSPAPPDGHHEGNDRQEPAAFSSRRQQGASHAVTPLHLSNTRVHPVKDRYAVTNRPEIDRPLAGLQQRTRVPSSRTPSRKSSRR